MTDGKYILLFGFGTLLLFAIVYFFFDLVRRTKVQSQVVGPSALAVMPAPASSTGRRRR
jgi:hypothetical protein